MISSKRRRPLFLLDHDVPCKRNFCHGKLNSWALAYYITRLDNCEPCKEVKVLFWDTKFESLKRFNCSVPFGKFVDSIVYVWLKRKFLTVLWVKLHLDYSIRNQFIPYLNWTDKITLVKCHNLLQRLCYFWWVCWILII